MGYIEKKQLQSQVNISFMRGKMNKGESGRNVYKLDDGFNVFENVKGTPKYWRQVKNELIARLENFGPFAFFFTLSCADLRWPENFTSLLQDKKIIFFDRIWHRKSLC